MNRDPIRDGRLRVDAEAGLFFAPYSFGTAAGFKASK